MRLFSSLSSSLTAIVSAVALFAPASFAAAQVQSSVTPAEARSIAKDAYIYGFPVVDHYRVQYDYFVNSSGPEFKAPWNHIANIPRVFTPADKSVQTPNSDTPYSWMGLDLRAEPIVLTLPPMEKKRYFSVQFTDAYTYNFDYLGTRTTGNGGGNYLVVGPNWKGATPAGMKKVVRSETQLVTLVYRTQLFNPDDLDNVKKIQTGYKVQPLSQFLGTAPPEAPPAINFIKPLSPEDQKTSLEFFSVLNFALQFCPTNPQETRLMARFSRIDVGAGKTFDPAALSPEMKAAIQQGMADAWVEFAGGVNRFSSGQLTSGDVFGTRAYMKGNYLNRMLGTIGIFGNSKEEALYPIYYVDSDKQKLSGANRYTLRFARGQLPPVNAFWSLTMYELPASLLVDNSINRYLINSPMLPQLKRDSDGGLTLYIQHESPGKEKEANWLPAPEGPFSMYLRLYWPKDEALDGEWSAPPAKRVQ